MKKLSEISNDTMITVEHRYDGDFEVMSKADFLESAYFLDFPVEPFPMITIADAVRARFSLSDAIETLSDEMHEDWFSDVGYALAEALNIKEIEKKINDILDEYPTYYQGETINIDIEP